MKKDNGMFMEITACSGETFEVDISDEVCLKFGFKHGDKVLDPTGDEVTIMGVAPWDVQDKGSLKVLWFVEDKGNSKASHWSRRPNGIFLPKEGFEKIEGKVR